MTRLLLLATGGTIAGRGTDTASLNTYTAGVLAGDELLDAVPSLQDLAEIRVEQVANVDSADLLFQHWRALVQRIRLAFASDPALAGVVISHGTNTLEETAWLLQQLIDDPRPVVLVGAMRPATALSADGPLNLFQAVQVACNPQARQRGVLAVMDGEIHSAAEVTKRATQGVGAFTSSGAGPLGWLDDAGVHWSSAPASPPTPFATLELPERWPQVAVMHGCVEPPAVVLQALLKAGIQGLVFTGTGAGQLSVVERTALAAWPDTLPLMLRANRCGSGSVYEDSEDGRLGLLAAGSLNPQKARVLLLLAVIAGWNRDDLAALLGSAHQCDLGRVG